MKTIARLGINVLLIACLTGCGGGSAIHVAKRFWNAVGDGNLEKARSYATRATAASLTMNNAAGKDADVNVEFGGVTVEGDRTIIETRMGTRMGDSEQHVEMKTVLVREDGEWKVDVINTMMSMFGDAAQGMMEGMAETMGQVTEEMSNAMMKELQKGFAQFGTFGKLNRGSPVEAEKIAGSPDYRIKFGYMKKRPDGTHYIYKETKKIPLRTRGFKWGYTIEAKGDPFTTHAMEYSTDGPMSEDGYPKTNVQGEQGWESNTITVTDGHFSRAYENYPGDSPGERKIEVYVDDKLARTIEFEITNP